MSFEEIVFNIIGYSGDSKAYCFQSLSAAREGDFKECDELMEKSKAELLKAHHIQTKMIQEEASGTKQELNLLMVHAQDHLMNAALAKDLIEEMILMYKKFK
ncbi:MAG TPA: PTS lactose/cellobiose transporter subunit IIA [Desulfosporosinus sp.]|nr:PTS lactose/cellobiose transporter subunit IIA [Desulfosporosinus sp.]